MIALFQSRILARISTTLVLLSAVVATSVQAAPGGKPGDAPACFDRQKLRDHVVKFQINTIAYSNLTFLCGEARKTNHLLTLVEALEFVRSLSFEEVPKKNLSALTPGHVKKDYYTHLATYVRTFEPNYDGECWQGWCAFASLMPFERVVKLSKSFFDRKISDVLIRTGALIHESRHAQGDGYRHVECSRGQYKGMRGSCDPSFSYAGSYAVETEYYARLYLYGTKLDRKLRILAREYALDRLRSKFNRFSPAAQGKEVVILVRENGTLALFDGDHVRSLPGALRAGEILFPTMSVPAKGRAMVPRFDVLSENRASFRPNCLFKMDAALAGCESSTGGEAAAALAKLSPAKKTALQDLRDFGDDGVIFAFRDHIELVKGEIRQVYPFRNPEFVDKVPGCDLEARAGQVIVKDAAQNVYLVMLSGIGGRYEKFQCRWTKGIKAYADLQRRGFALKESGEVVEHLANGKAGVIPALAGQKFSKMIQAAQRYYPALDSRD